MIDMELKRKHGIRNWKRESDINNHFHVSVVRDRISEPWIGTLGSLESITEELMHWSGADYLHSWFLNNVDHAFEPGVEYPINYRTLLLLRSHCELCVVKDTKLVNKYFPDSWCKTCFGDGDKKYDALVLDCLKETMQVLDSILEEHRYIEKHGRLLTYVYIYSF
jgi:hypothetical protein